MNTNPQITSIRAIEALRSGVPNWDAVQALGSSQPFVEQKFKKTLQAVSPALDQNRGPQGMIFAGDFGAGKSHLLEYLQHVALENKFVCSKVVISKETPLYDLDKLYRAAIQSARVDEWIVVVAVAVAEAESVAVRVCLVLVRAWIAVIVW